METNGHGSHHRSRHLSAVPAYDSERSYADHCADQLAEYMMSVEALVGGHDALMRLDAEPLPDEPFDWATVEPQDHAFVTVVLELVERYCEEVLDGEYLTIARRILARVAVGDPRVLRRSQNAERCAAGLVWLVGRASGRFDRSDGPPSRRELWEWFGVTDCSERGRRLQRAADLVPPYDLRQYVFPGDLALGNPELLHSSYRRALMLRRDMKSAAEREREREQHSPVVSFEGSRLVIAAVPVAVLGAAKSLPVDGVRQGICIMLGTELDDAACYDVSIPDAHKLVQCVQAALADPPPPR